ncbi:MAG: AMP phosphorylase [Thermoplasmata archaeon]|nr:AMP phosphorylase [Thermoplasmata archaeon]MBR4244206.1 AMP phosphorylase [Candidatus Methanomethylophilaceae archaeon]MBR6213824.1 AMP phosphorylase [Candidatus Methanomethylophilaceae archaeon]
MKFKIKTVDVRSLEPQILLDEEDCIELGVKENDRVSITGERSAISLVSYADNIVEKGVAIVPKNIVEKTGLNKDGTVNITYAHNPDSVRYIRMKMDGERLSKEQIEAIVRDILDNRLSRIEVSAWLTALYINGMDIDEIADFTMAMANTGDIIKFSRTPVFDFHSLGGVPGNKITPIVISIVAAAGLMIPKTSSRAISSACGTSDFVETFCDVELSSSKLMAISEEVGGVFAWGGSMNLAPVDDMVIKIEHPLGINPRAQMLASIMSKKVAMGSTHLLVDIPTGSGSKVPTLEEAKAYARDLMDLGERIGMHVECAITYADQPIGMAIGPNLEARECISILEGEKHPSSVIEKACECAGIILEMAGVPNGATRAREILDSGEAHKKFLEIVVAQNGRPDLKSSDLKPGDHSFDLKATNPGYVHAIRNKEIVNIAKAAGSPSDKGAGLLIYKKKGQRVEAGDVLMTIYAESDAKLKRAQELAMSNNPFDIEGMLIKRVTEVKPR